jgi:hypothetical protein
MCQGLRLWQELLSVEVATTIRAARMRWSAGDRAGENAATRISAATKEARRDIDGTDNTGIPRQR